jgi:conjugal transfer ATP-binding protein TraC
MITDYYERQNKEGKFSDLLPVIDYVKKPKGRERFGYFVLDDGYIGRMYELKPVSGGNAELQNMMEDIFKTEFPEDTFAQVMLWANEDVSGFEQNFAHFHGGRQSNPETDEKLTAMSKMIAKHYRRSAENGFDNSNCRARNFNAYLTIKIPVKGRYGRPLDKEFDDFYDKCITIEETLTKVGLRPQEMDQWDWLSVMQRMHNRRDSASWRKGKKNKNELYMAREQVMEVGGAVEFQSDKVLIDEKPIASLSPKTYPSAIGFGDMLNVFSDWRFGHNTIWSNFAIVLNVHFPNHDKKKRSKYRMRKTMDMQKGNKLVNWSEKVRWQLGDLDEMYKKLEAKGSRLVNCHLQFFVWGDDEEDLQRQVSRMKKIASSPAGFELELDKYMTSPLFLHCTPFGPDKPSMDFINRYLLMPSDVAAFLTPVIASSDGNAPHEPIVPFVTRDMQLFGFNPYLTNGSMNFLISAESGSGKSFVINYIATCILGSGKKPSRYLLSLLEEMSERELATLAKTLPAMNMKHCDGGMVMIIDVGYSYKNLCEALNGQYITFGEDMKYSLNPFPSIVEWGGKDGQSGMILDLLKWMADPKGRLSRIQEAQMPEVLQSMWNDHKQASSVTLFAEYCKKHKLPEIQEIALMIEPYCEGKIYGDIFTTKKPPPDLDNPFIVCELEELKSLPEVQLLALMQIINLCYRHFFLSDENPSDRRRKMLVIDECWEFLQKSENGKEGEMNPVSNFLDQAYRRFRKVEASAGICTQMLSDIHETQLGRSIAANSVYRFYLYQKSDTINTVKKNGYLDLTDQQFELLKSVRTVKGKYSEIFLQIGDEISEIVRLYAPKEMLLMYSTDPQDRQDLARYREMGLSLDEAIERVLEDRGDKSFGDDIKNRVNEFDEEDAFFGFLDEGTRNEMVH